MGKFLRKKKKSRLGENCENNKAKKIFVVSGYEFYF